MLFYRAGMKVKKGTYWDMANGSRLDIAHDEILPGSRVQRYIRVPAVVMLVLGPVFGLFYVIFLPIASIAVVLILSIRKGLAWALGLVSKLAYFEWRPAESYLSGKKKVQKKDTKTHNKPMSGKKGG